MTFRFTLKTKKLSLWKTVFQTNKGHNSGIIFLNSFESLSGNILSSFLPAYQVSQLQLLYFMIYHNGVAVTYIKGILIDQAVIPSIAPISKWELLLKERICSQRERILSFESSTLWYEKITSITLSDLT